MKRILFSFLTLGLLSFVASNCVFAEEDSTVFEELKSELRQEGVSPEDIEDITEPVKNMFGKGAKKKDIEDVVVGLSKKGVKGKVLKDSVESMNELVEDGEDPKEAGNIVSQAAHAALAAGLKGKDLAAKVHEAIQQRKQERAQLKQQKKEEKEQEKMGRKQSKSKEKAASKGKSSGKGKGKE